MKVVHSFGGDALEGKNLIEDFLIFIGLIKTNRLNCYLRFIDVAIKHIILGGGVYILKKKLFIDVSTISTNVRIVHVQWMKIDCISNLKIK